MATTIRDVAAKAGVGLATVSRVLNNSPLVSPSTRERVQAAIAELNFTPNPTARRLSLGKTLTIAVIAPWFTRPSSVERLRGIEQTLLDTPYDMVVVNVETVERRDRSFREIPRPDRADGVIIISFTPDEPQVKNLLVCGVPVILVDAYHSAFTSVMEDSVRGGFLATQHLTQLGHQRIGYISDVFDDPFNFTSRSRYRFDGYRTALEAAGLPFRPEFCRQGEHGREQARQMALELLNLPERPTAIFAASDTQALGILEAAQTCGLQVPAELSVVGYDDIEVAEYLNLTTIRQLLFASGKRGVELLVEAIEGHLPEPVYEALPVEMIVRGTTARPNSN